MIDHQSGQRGRRVGIHIKGRGADCKEDWEVIPSFRQKRRRRKWMKIQKKCSGREEGTGKSHVTGSFILFKKETK